ncbi:MAG: carboxymuconolactone decarboxylase family protein [Saprospiraceae bacterium]
MTWIKTIEYSIASSKLKRVYDRVKGPGGEIDNILKAHSLRPHTLIGHMTLYKNVLHNLNNTLPKWYLEAVGVYVSFLNKCSYCVEHHSEGLRRLLDDSGKNAELVIDALQNDMPQKAFDGKFFLGLKYAKKLTLGPAGLVEADIRKLREAGFGDGEILEINQVVAYFNYANRTVLGLGVNTEGDVLGLSPNDSDDPGNWSHR